MQISSLIFLNIQIFNILEYANLATQNYRVLEVITLYTNFEVDAQYSFVNTVD